jgi:hypothetical protein
MAASVFIPQALLNQWSDQGKVELEGNVLRLLHENREVDLAPAVRFLEVLGGEADPNGLLRKVKTKTQLDELGAEHYMDSVILGDLAYQVEATGT